MLSTQSATPQGNGIQQNGIIHTKPQPSQDPSSATTSKPVGLGQFRSFPGNSPVMISSDSAPEDDTVEEYTFSSEEDVDQEDDDMDDAESHISVSSDERQVDDYSIDDRPWLHMTEDGRKHYESMFTATIDRTVGGSLTQTEEYQAQLDNIMEQYIDDFPLSQWVVGKEAASRAYIKLVERKRLRTIGVKIHNFEPEMLSGAITVSHAPRRPRTSSNATSRVSAPVEAAMRAEADVLNGVKPMVMSDSPQHKHPVVPRIITHGSTRPYRRPLISPTTTNYRVPPYPAHKRPVDEAPPVPSSKRTVRRPAEAETLPWTRDLDFEAVKAAASWDDSVYDPQTFETMTEVRRLNEPIIEALDLAVAEKQRNARIARKNREMGQDDGTPVEPAKRGRKKKDPNDHSGHSDPYHQGNFAFYSIADEKKALRLQYASPEDLIEAGEAGRIDLEDLKDIMICWNPGKKGDTHHLSIAPFSPRDSIITRQQLARTPILTQRAAECIIDFSPDLLWREMLLRVISEAGCSNKDVRDRFCMNGCHADKATFTKRLSAALGQKQVQARGKSYAPGEEELYRLNCEDFKAYSEFFGKRMINRSAKTGLKRARSSNAPDSADAEELVVKRATSSFDGTSDGVPGSAMEDNGLDRDGDEQMKTSEGEDHDGVSLQNSDDLDGLSD